MKYFPVPPNQEWRCNVILELINVRDGSLENNLDNNEVTTIINFLCTTWSMSGKMVETIFLLAPSFLLHLKFVNILNLMGKTKFHQGTFDILLFCSLLKVSRKIMLNVLCRNFVCPIKWKFQIWKCNNLGRTKQPIQRMFLNVISCLMR